ncbi:flagellar hook-length control protein FliK [Maricaulis sp. MIT060901]|uniref:flagellar hook-length control protein FliK n=1 Tax=Maricaulis sp. MIT060901 TaxID=3096993 RepID=UPI00399A9C8C
MNATFLSSGTASAAGAVATPGNNQAGGQDNGVFQALLAGQAEPPGAGGFGTPVATNNIGRIDLPVDTAGGTLLKPAVADTLSDLPPQTRSIAQDLGTVFAQLRTQISEIRNALASASDTAGQPSVAAQASGTGIATTTISDDVAPLNIQPAASQADTVLNDQPIHNDPLIAMLEPMRDQLAALGIDIDTLGSTGPAAATPAIGKPLAPVQEPIATSAALKSTVQVQDTPIPATSTAATETGLAKTLRPEPARPEATQPQRASLIDRMSERLEDLKHKLGGLQLPTAVMHGLENTISQLNTLSQLNSMITAPVAEPMIASLAAHGAPLPTTPASSTSPAGAMATATPTGLTSQPSPPGALAPLSTATTEEATPAAAGQAGAAKQASANQSIQDPAAQSKIAPAMASPSKAAATPASEANLPAFAAPPTRSSAAQQATAAGPQATATAPATPVATTAAPTTSAEPAPELVAAAQQARPTSTPGSQLAERNNKVASSNALAGSSGAKAGTTSGSAPNTGQPQPPTSPNASPNMTTPAEAILQEPRAATPMPGQAGFDPQLAQSQPVSEQNLGLRTDQDLSLQRADGRSAAERPTHEGQRFTPQSAQQLAAQITRRFANGNRVFDIRLDPAELGRVDVRLELTGDQRVQAILSVERPETLAELQRSARDLERALNEAGLELENDGLEFQLNENADDQGFDADEDPGVLPVFVESDELEMAALANEPAIERDAYGFRLAASRDRLDMRI